MAAEDTKDLSGVTAERREYFRIDEILPFDYEKPLKKKEKLTDLVRTADLGRNEALLRLLEAIDSKLDTLIEALSREGTEVCDLPVREVNISAGGVRFRTDERFEKGETVKVKLGLPPYPFKVICLLAEVVRVEETIEDDKRYFETAVKFLYIDEEIRKKILESLMEIQRKRIGKRG